MHKIEKNDTGYLLTFGGSVSAEEMTAWMRESVQALEAEKGAFCVVVDMRTLAPLTPETQAVMLEGRKLYKQRGMTGSSVLLAHMKAPAASRAWL